MHKAYQNWIWFSILNKNMRYYEIMETVYPFDIHPSTDDVYEVMSSNFEYSKLLGNKLVAINKLKGGVNLSNPTERKRIDSLKNAIKNNRYISRLIVDTEGNVIEGQHRLEALRELGVKEAPVTIIQDLADKINIPEMEKAIKNAQPMHSDHVHQLIKEILNGVSKEGSVKAYRDEWEAPQGFEKGWNAGLDFLENKKLFETVLLERHEDIVTLLRPYAESNDPNLYITFSDIMKLGINPKYEYDTPTGIYAYPLTAMWDKIVSNTVPFAGDRKYVHLFSAGGKIVDVSDYTAADMKQDLEKLKTKYQAYFTHPRRDDYDIWYNFCVYDQKSEDSPEEIKKQCQEIFKNGQGFDMAAYEWARNSFLKKPISEFWNITRHLSMRLASSVSERFDRKSSAIWNTILRNLGYSGFSDKTGMGVIHSNEPKQAVFFSINGLKHIKTFENIRKIRDQDVDNNGKYVINSLANIVTFLMSRKPDDTKSNAIQVGNSFIRKSAYFSRLGAYAANEWQEIFDKGVSEHFSAEPTDFYKSVSSKEQFVKSIYQNWGEFVRALLRINYKENFPKLVQEVCHNPILKPELEYYAKILIDRQPKNLEESRVYVKGVLGEDNASLFGFIVDIREDQIKKHSENFKNASSDLSSQDDWNEGFNKELVKYWDNEKKEILEKVVRNIVKFLPSGDVQENIRRIKKLFGYSVWLTIKKEMPEIEKFIETTTESLSPLPSRKATQRKA